jgi:ATP/ADP translocase
LRRRTLVFFNPFKRKEKRRGILLFFLGIALVLLKRTFIGMIVETFGMVAMFGGLLPIVVSFLSSVPVVGPLFASPTVASAVNALAGATARRPPV